MAYYVNLARQSLGLMISVQEHLTAHFDLYIIRQMYADIKHSLWLLFYSLGSLRNQDAEDNIDLKKSCYILPTNLAVP